MSDVLNLISNILPITQDPLIDSILFLIIGSIAFAAAWFVTGDLADSVGNNSAIMSLIHWAIRLFVFFVLLGIIIGLVHFVRWISSWAWWGYLILGGVIGLITALIFEIRTWQKKKNKNKPPKNPDWD